MPTSTASRSQPLPNARRLRLAYLTTEYPKVSHTFIRREILELERRGNTILRLAIRDSGGAIADGADVDEAKKTFHCLSQPKWRFLTAIIATKVAHPIQWLRAVWMMLDMRRRSDRGLITHCAYLAEAALLLRVLRKNKIQHVHVHFGTNAAAVARLMFCLGGPTYSMTVHGPDEFDSPRGFSLREKIEDASFVVAISDFCSAQLKRWVGPEQWHKIHVVHCTVSEEFLATPKPVVFGSRTLLSIGRLSAQKGQLVLLDAMKELIECGVDAKLILAGDGEMRAEIENRIAKLGLQQHVQVTGWIDEKTVRKHLQECRALVQPSFAEGLPVVMMEALAMGRPVIATTIAGVPELVKHGENGWLVSAGNVDELVTAMREAMTVKIDVLNEMGRMGHERVQRQHFTVTEIDKLETLFAQFGGSA